MTIKPADAVWLHHLYSEDHARVLSWLKTKTGSDWALAEDLTAETFVRAWRYRDSFTGGKPGAWLQVIARNVFLDHVKSARVRWEVPVGDFWVSVGDCTWDEPVDGDTPEQLVLDREAEVLQCGVVALVVDCINGLSARRQAECLRLRYVCGLSVGETAVVMGLSVGAVRVLTHRAVLNVRTSMSRDEAA